MRTIKFRYRVQERKTGEIFTFITALNEIEIHAFDPNPFDRLRYKILSRDEGIGLPDRNGNEIWEGDIVKSPLRMPGGEIYLVEWNQEYAEFSIQKKEICEKYVEVIGNVHENPELLGEPK